MSKYLKQDSELGFVEDNAEIGYLRFNNMRRTVLGCMLGDFDAEGRYVVAPEIKRELISMRKYFVESIENIDICVSELKLDKQISFAITFEGNRATLSLLEKVNFEANFKINSGSYSNINEYILDEVETSGVVDRGPIYRRWNVGEYGGSVLDVFNMDEATLASMFGIVDRFKYLMKANTILLDQEKHIEAIETEHIISTLELVKRYPKLKKIVDKQLKQELGEKKQIICIDKPNFAKALNELVEKVVENNLNILSDADKKEFKTEKHNIDNRYNIQVRDVVDIKTEPQVENNHEHKKIMLDTKGVERGKTTVEVGTDLVRVQQQVNENARKSAQEAINSDIVDNNKSKNAVNIGEFLGARQPADIIDRKDSNLVSASNSRRSKRDAVSDEANKNGVTQPEKPDEKVEDYKDILIGVFAGIHNLRENQSADNTKSQETNKGQSKQTETKENKGQERELDKDVTSQTKPTIKPDETKENPVKKDKSEDKGKSVGGGVKPDNKNDKAQSTISTKQTETKKGKDSNATDSYTLDYDDYDYSDTNDSPTETNKSPTEVETPPNTVELPTETPSETTEPPKDASVGRHRINNIGTNVRQAFGKVGLINNMGQGTGRDFSSTNTNENEQQIHSDELIIQDAGQGRQINDIVPEELNNNL